MLKKVLAWGLCAVVAASGPAAADWKTNATAYLDGLTPAKTPTISICVSVDGKVVYSHAAGQIAPGTPATTDMIYRIGSVSKQFTAAGILALVEDNWDLPIRTTYFSLDDQTSQFFPYAQNWTVNNPSLTVRRLLNMQSGLPNYTAQPPAGLDPAKPIDANTLLQGLKTYTPSATPLAFEYSNTNYFLLATIIDEVYLVKPRGIYLKKPGDIFGYTHPGYEAWLKNRIFARAGLTSTNFIDDPKPLGTMVPPDPNGTVADFANPNWPKGAGAIQSSVMDLCRWDAALMQDKVLNKASLATMGTAGPLSSPAQGTTPATHYAMGWWVTQYPTYLQYYHDGIIPGYQAENLIDVYGNHFVAVAVLANSNSVGNLYDIANSAANFAMKP